MKRKWPVILTIALATYLGITLTTGYSLTGFWTDPIFSVLLCIIALILVFKDKTKSIWFSILLKTTNIICSLIVLGLLFLNLFNPYAWPNFKGLHSFSFQKIDDRLFHAYFSPVGIYSGGYGKFWITESPKYFPIIEHRVYYNDAVDHDFNNDTFEGRPIDNEEVVKSYIRDEVINKNK